MVETQFFCIIFITNQHRFMKLLIVEDEIQLSNSIVKFLSKEDYLCEQSFTFSDAYTKVGVYEYDCILLDLMLPGGNGLDILKKIRARTPHCGVIIISAKDSIEDKVLGLKIGADDYLAKPFHLPELSMRIFAILRRKSFNSSNILESGGIKIDLLSKTIEINGNNIELTKTEYELLLFLIENKKRVVSKSSLAEHICGDMADMMSNFNFIYAHIKNLKIKIKDAGAIGSIKTFYGTGYKWIEDEKESE